MLNVQLIWKINFNHLRILYVFVMNFALVVAWPVLGLLHPQRLLRSIVLRPQDRPHQWPQKWSHRPQPPL